MKPDGPKKNPQKISSPVHNKNSVFHTKPICRCLSAVERTKASIAPQYRNYNAGVRCICLHIVIFIYIYI